MNVQELIERLQQAKPESTVLIYDAGEMTHETVCRIEIEELYGFGCGLQEVVILKSRSSPR